MLSTLIELTVIMGIAALWMVPITIAGAAIAYIIEYFGEKDAQRLRRELHPEEKN